MIPLMVASRMNTALVTGANKGIGPEVARQLGGMGFHVFLGARNSENGEKTTQALRKTGAMATFVPLDVSGPESIRNAVHLFLRPRTILTS